MKALKTILPWFIVICILILTTVFCKKESKLRMWPWSTTDGNGVPCCEMSKQASNTFIWFVLVNHVLSLGEPEFRMNEITHLPAVIPGAHWLGHVCLAWEFFFLKYKGIDFPGALCLSEIKLVARKGYTCRIWMP